MKIEVVNVGPLHGGDSDKYKLSIDGVIDDSSHVYDETLYIKSADSIDKFKSLKISEISIFGLVEFTQFLGEWKLSITLVLQKVHDFYRWARAPNFFICRAAI